MCDPLPSEVCKILSSGLLIQGPAFMSSPLGDPKSGPLVSICTYIHVCIYIYTFGFT